jgi:hypothetical protein
LLQNSSNLLKHIKKNAAVFDISDKDKNTISQFISKTSLPSSKDKSSNNNPSVVDGVSKLLPQVLHTLQTLDCDPILVNKFQSESCSKYYVMDHDNSSLVDELEAFIDTCQSENTLKSYLFMIKNILCLFENNNSCSYNDTILNKKVLNFMPNGITRIPGLIDYKNIITSELEREHAQTFKSQPTICITRGTPECKIKDLEVRGRLISGFVSNFIAKPNTGIYVFEGVLKGSNPSCRIGWMFACNDENIDDKYDLPGNDDISYAIDGSSRAIFHNAKEIADRIAATVAENKKIIDERNAILACLNDIVVKLSMSSSVPEEKCDSGRIESKVNEINSASVATPVSTLSTNEMQGGAPAIFTPQTPGPQTDKYSEYLQMQKFGVPEAAIRSKMASVLTDAEIEIFFSAPRTPVGFPESVNSTPSFSFGNSTSIFKISTPKDASYNGNTEVDLSDLFFHDSDDVEVVDDKKNTTSKLDREAISESVINQGGILVENFQNSEETSIMHDCGNGSVIGCVIDTINNCIRFFIDGVEQRPVQANSNAAFENIRVGAYKPVFSCESEGSGFDFKLYSINDVSSYPIYAKKLCSLESVAEEESKVESEILPRSDLATCLTLNCNAIDIHKETIEENSGDVVDSSIGHVIVKSNALNKVFSAHNFSIDISIRLCQNLNETCVCTSSHIPDCNEIFTLLCFSFKGNKLLSNLLYVTKCGALCYRSFDGLIYQSANNVIHGFKLYHITLTYASSKDAINLIVDGKQLVLTKSSIAEVLKSQQQSEISLEDSSDATQNAIVSENEDKVEDNRISEQFFCIGAELSYYQVNEVTSYLPVAKSKFVGDVFDVRIWSSIRSEPECKEYMGRNVLNGSEKRLVAYWRLTEQTGSLIHDCSYTDNANGPILGVMYGDCVWGSVDLLQQYKPASLPSLSEAEILKYLTCEILMDLNEKTNSQLQANKGCSVVDSDNSKCLLAKYHELAKEINTADKSYVSSLDLLLSLSSSLWLSASIFMGPLVDFGPCTLPNSNFQQVQRQSQAFGSICDPSAMTFIMINSILNQLLRMLNKCKSSETGSRIGILSIFNGLVRVLRLNIRELVIENIDHETVGLKYLHNDSSSIPFVYRLLNTLFSCVVKIDLLNMSSEELQLCNSLQYEAVHSISDGMIFFFRKRWTNCFSWNVC